MDITTRDMDRRTFVKGIIGVGAGMLVAPMIFIPRIVKADEGEKVLSFYNINTAEYLKKCVFWSEGAFNVEAENEISHFFRDFRTGEKMTIDRELIQLLHRIHEKLETTELIHLISGYRSPKTNAALRKKSKGVASKSQHPLGKAADILIPGRSLKVLKEASKGFRAGGVGLYRRFIHVDTGPIRYW